MAEFVFGRHADEKTEYILEKMRSSLASGKKVIIIVPEQQALFWDTLTSEKLSETDAFNIDTLSFTRLADNVFRKYGGTAETYVNDAQKTLIMWNAIISLADKMEYFRTLDREDRYVPQLLRAVNELKMYSVSPAELMEASEKIEGGGTLPARLRDISKIYSAYDSILHTSFSDPLDIPDTLCEVLKVHDYFSDYSVFIDSFYTLTPKEMSVVSEIFKSTDDITVTFAISREDRGDDCTSFVWDYVKDMTCALEKCGKVPEIRDIEAHMSPESEYISENLWNYNAEPFEKKTDKITFLKCSDRYDEAFLTACQIRKLINSGAKYSDIAVVASDMESLRGITDTELQRFGIPVYLSGRTPLTSQPAFKLISAALTVIGGGFRKGDIISLAKTGLCNITPDMCDAFEKYVCIWDINGKKAYFGDDWDMNPDGYVESFNEWGNDMLSLANEAKNTIIPPLEDLCTTLKGNVSDACRGIFKLLCDFNVYGQLKAEVKSLEEKSDIAAAQEKSQVWSALCSILDTLSSTVPDAAAEPFRLSALLRKVAETVSIGTIPDGIDRVMLGSVTGMRLDGFRHLIVLGAAAGEFPAVPHDDGFFSDRDRILMENVGISISPTSDKKLGEELFRFKYTVSSPSDTLTVIIPDGSPSIGAAALMRLFPGMLRYDFTSPDNSAALTKFAGLGNEISDISLSADGDRLNESFAKDLFGHSLRMTQSRIETYNDCPFKYYGEYVLHLESEKTAQINNADVGTFVHAILENFMREAAQDNVFPIEDGIIVSRSDRLVKRYIANVCPDSVGSRRNWLFRRISKSIKLYAQSLSEEFAQSRFRPYKFELEMGYDSNLPTKPIPLSDDAQMTIRGKIDRVDILREDGNVYLRVADYKTGSKKFSLKDVMEGRNVQLLLYLFSLCDSPLNCGFRQDAAPNGEKLIPAGAQYFSAVTGNVKSDNIIGKEEAREKALSAISRNGIVLEDRSVIEAMDRDFTGAFAPVTLTKGGEYKKTSSVATLDGFKNIEEAMYRSLSEIGDNIRSGCAGSTPVPHGGTSPCKYCKMQAFCRHENNSEEVTEDDE